MARNNKKKHHKTPAAATAPAQDLPQQAPQSGPEPESPEPAARAAEEAPMATATPLPEPVVQPKKPSDEEASHKEDPQGDCLVCNQLAKCFCSGCKHVFYCSRDHQRQDWKNHKEDCRAMAKLPYRVQRSPQLGRYLVATADLQPGQLIFNESPMLVGPRQLSKPVCLGCHKELKDADSVTACSRCTWPLCSTKCQDSPFHEPECRILRYGGTKMSVDGFGQINMMYACITVLRALALKVGPEKIWNEYTLFESHLEQRMKSAVYTKVNKEKVVFFIQHYLKLLSKFSDLEILEACGRLDTNCFELRQDGLNLRCLYRTASIMAHDCRPNTRHTFSSKDYSISVYATVPIAKGHTISVTYTQPLWCTFVRRDHLHMSKCFWCQCQRCSDPTEFGTFLSALICSKCGGRILPSDPLDQEAVWKCDKCPHFLTARQIREGNTRLTEDLRHINRSDPEALDNFINKFANILPDTHQLVREVHCAMVFLSRSVSPDQLDSKYLLKKSCLSKQLLQLADKIEPGQTKWRGELLFQMQAAAVVLAQRALQEDKISKYQAQQAFEESLAHLHEAVGILQVEPEGLRGELQAQMAHLSGLLEA